MSFELFVARRYLRAKQKEGFISVVTFLSVLGVTVGVAALVIAMAINNGVQQDLQVQLLGAASHLNLLQKNPLEGIQNWQEFLEKFHRVEHVEAIAPALYGEVMISGAIRGRGCFLKGVEPERELRVADLLTHLTEGSLDDLEAGNGLPGMILGERLANHIGARIGSVITVMNPQGEVTPFGIYPSVKRFRTAAIFRTGFFDYDSFWAYTRLDYAQQALSLPDVINSVEFKLDDLNQAAAVEKQVEAIAGDEFEATSWMERNRALFNALKVEKLVTAITIGLIMLVAALNILISLVMMVMEKRKDIAILMSLGARKDQVRRVFVWQGVLIGALGTACGLALGHLLSWACDRYRLIPLEAEIYGLSYVPFAPRVIDGLAVAAAAMLISFLITIYPSASAARVTPVEVLRYE